MADKENAEKLSDDDVEIVEEYTFEDFAYSEAPYKEVYEISTDFERRQRIEQLTIMANKVKYKNFKGTYKDYVKSINNKLKVQANEGKLSEHSGPYMQLDCGDYAVDDYGVRIMLETEITVCHHPILPIGILQNNHKARYYYGRTT